jgi:hypothetical protein
MKQVTVAVALLVSMVVSHEAMAASKCRGSKSAHCFCRVTATEQKFAPAPPDPSKTQVIQARGLHLFTYTIPDRCFNPVVDSVIWRKNKGCWLACRNAFGVDGHPGDPAVAALKLEAARKLRSLGACGGWFGAELAFAAGNNKYRRATASDIGIGIGGTIVVKDGKRVCR